MAKEAPQPVEEIVEGAPDWVVTFGDLMSLLLCFFVLLLSFSETDRQKYKEIAGALREAFGVQRETRAFESPRGNNIIARDFDRTLQLATRPKEELGIEIQAELQTHFRNMEEGIEVDANEERVIIRMMGETTFDSGRADIMPRMRPFLQRLGDVLRRTEGDLIVAGHTDNVPVRGLRFDSNLELSIARAAAVAEFLIRQCGVPPERIATMGFGEYRPIEANTTPDGRRKNRRVEVIVTDIPERLVSSGDPPADPDPGT